MLPRTLITSNTTLYTVSGSHLHALGLPQGPIYLLLDHTLSILVKTKNFGDAHDVRGFILPHTLHCHPLILGLARAVDHGIF